MCHVGALGAGGQKDIGIDVDMPTADYGVALSNATTVIYWTRLAVTVVGSPSKHGFTVRVYNEADAPISDVYFRWAIIC